VAPYSNVRFGNRLKEMGNRSTAAVVDSLNRISEPPPQKEDFDTWLEMGSALDFLRDNRQQDDFVVYASNRYTFVHAVLAPAPA